MITNQHDAANVPDRYTPSVADVAEAVFDILYLTFDLVAGIVFFAGAAGRPVFVLFGLLTFLLGAGDAFHLVPRIMRALRGSDERTKARLGLGLQVSSITMTAFYVLLYYIWRALFPQMSLPLAAPVIIWVTALARIAVCLSPSNNWQHAEGNVRLSALRNGIFALTGLVLIALFALSGNAGGLGLWRMSLAIAISFACYVPVTIWSRSHPQVGMLMIPKTCAYVWMIAMGLQLMVRMA
ncbi:hypothetical protein [Olsenella sp. HMSC062G07]|uniref:hypothetical protein n=1 Tax=Olsenella sp. HMSC062G07 TaxID=1739330 RepID=UPI0008A39EB0|nr:hypothetical protein [Olsenella sp. HMSC062G07]OFK24190.1 hypothetical protein HMPREF2826_08170 [Olsenella sp. HMSC062G07]